MHIQYTFEALYIKVNKQKVIKPLLQPKKSRKYMEVYPIPTTGFLFLIASVMKLTFDHYETFGLTKVLQDLSFQECKPGLRTHPTVQTQIRRHRTRYLIRVYSVCLKNLCYKFLKLDTDYR